MLSDLCFHNLQAQKPNFPRKHTHGIRCPYAPRREGPKAWYSLQRSTVVNRSPARLNWRLFQCLAHDPGTVCVCGFLLTWAGQSRIYGSLASHISAADLQGQLPISQSTSGFATRSVLDIGKEDWDKHYMLCIMCLSGFWLPRAGRNLGLITHRHL